jgi:hypothetical protein
MLISTEKGWKEVLQVIDMTSDPANPALLPTHVLSSQGSKVRVDGGDNVRAMKWTLDICENPMRQRRKLHPFPEFAKHQARHEWDAAKNAAPEALKIGKGLVKAPGDARESMPGKITMFFLLGFSKAEFGKCIILECLL